MTLKTKQSKAKEMKWNEESEKKHTHQRELNTAMPFVII